MTLRILVHYVSYASEELSLEIRRYILVVGKYLRGFMAP